MSAHELKGERNADGTDQRYYSSAQGRFLTPDPYRASGGPADPQSWNRYAYVQGDPVNFGDVIGLARGPVEIQTPPIEVRERFSPVPVVITDIIGVRRDSDTMLLMFAQGGTFTSQAQIWEEQLDVAIQELNAEDIEAASDLTTFADCAWKGFVSHFGLSAAAAVSGALATPIPKQYVPPYRQIGTPTTNLLSVIGHFVEVNIPRVAVGSRATANLLRLAGRVNPYLALGLAAVDAAMITKSAVDCYEEEKGKQQKAQEPTQ